MKDIIGMARAAGWTEYSLLTLVEVQRLERFADLAAAAEREACAKVCEDEAEKWEGDDGPISTEARLCAINIRARGGEMNKQPEALRLADRLDLWGDQGDLLEAAAELRRLHASCEDYAQHKQRQDQRILTLTAQRDALRAELKEATEAINDPAVNNLRTLAESIRMLRAQRDALLEALRKIAAIENKMVGPDWEEIEEARGIARAAIAKAEGKT